MGSALTYTAWIFGFSTAPVLQMVPKVVVFYIWKNYIIFRVQQLVIVFQALGLEWGGPYCAIAGCVGGYNSKHRFPNPEKYPELFQRWIELCGRPELVDRAADRVYNSLRVCRIHFTEDCFGRNNVLLRTAIPSLHLPEPLRLNVDEQLENIDPNIGQSTAADPNISQSTTADLGILDICIEKVEDSSLRQPETLHSGEEIQIIDQAVNEPGPFCQGSDFDLGAVTPTRKRKHEILKRIGVKKATNLSPKSRYLYKQITFFKRQAYNRNRKLRAKKLSRKEVLRDALSSMDRVRGRFFQSQIENKGRHPRGRRFTLDDKILALVLQKHCGSGYKTLSGIFDLPSKRTLHRVLERIHIKAGLNKVCFSLFKATTFSNDMDKYCILMFDEMSISPHLQFNRKEDVVEGFEEFGYRSSNKIANHVQVFMLRGIRRKWKQPVFYNSVYGATSADHIVRILKLVASEAQNSGLRIIATVCDQGTNNVRAIKNLVDATRGERLKNGVDCQDLTFNLCGMEIIPLFDVPHLLKGVRNSLLKYTLHFEDNFEKKTAKWDHIYTAYKMDPYVGSVRSMPRLTDNHVHKDHIKKMKVSYCTQVLSASVAKAINIMAFKGLSIESSEGLLTLPNEAIQTAECCQFFDQLFDSLNGSTLNSTKQWKKAATEQSGHIAFWNKCLKVIDTMFYMDEQTGRKVIPPTLGNLKTTLNNFKILAKKLWQLGFPHIMPRTFNQDPIENFFGQIRQRSYRYVNPTFASFGPLYKSLLIRNITSKHSLGGNCENDNSTIFFTLNDFLREGHPADDTNKEAVEPFAVPEKFSRPASTLHRPILSYISGYICNKIPSIRTCDVCKKHYLTYKTAGDEHLFTREKEMDENRRLVYVNSNTLQAVSQSYSIILYILDNYLSYTNIKRKIMATLLKKVNFQQSNCVHAYQVKLQIYEKLTVTLIHNYVKQLNNVVHGKDLRPITKQDPTVFQAARTFYLKYKKR